MSLKFAILGFLSTTPATGYDLAKQFTDGIGASWYAIPSQIYPELRRLEADGLIAGESSTNDRLNKRTYVLSERGQQELQRWIESAIEYPPTRDPERIQLILMDESKPEVIRAHLLRHRAHFEARHALWQERLDELLQGTQPRLRARLAGRPATSHALVKGLKIAAVEGNLDRADLEIKWVDRTIAWLDTLKAPKAIRKGARASPARTPKPVHAKKARAPL
jgi:DNA-binding PadR family transcriptional regulator